MLLFRKPNSKRPVARKGLGVIVMENNVAHFVSYHKPRIFVARLRGIPNCPVYM